ncbi:MAG TPA: hypothetical protein VFG42_16150 [Baekduia sp.]|nr:hypothetical protein [Baekduia sp.]
MLRRRRNAIDDDRGRDVVVDYGPSLAKGPAMIAGAILVAFGLCALLKNNDFPSFSASFPNADVHGTNFLGIEVNGWTCFFSITAGALLLFGAAQHHLAKLMSLLVGLALVACAVIAVIDGHDVLGLAATNGWTKLGFAVAGVAMLLNALMPRVQRRREVATGAAAGTGAGAAPVAGDTTATRRRRFGRPGRVRGDAPVADRAQPRATAAPEEAPRGPRHHPV